MKRLALMLALAGCHGEARVAERPATLPSPAPSAAVTTAAVVEHKPANDDRFGDPRAWFNLAEAAFERADLTEAAREYEQVLHTDNDLVGYAWYKLAFVRWNQSEGARALEAMVRALQWADAHPGATAKRLGAQARRDLVPIFAQVGRPASAYGFFHVLLLKDADTLEALRALAQAYVDQGKADSAAVVRSELAARSPPK